jgi:cell division protein ZipA
MSLQLSLLLIGIAIVVIIALVTRYRDRLTTRLRRPEPAAERVAPVIAGPEPAAELPEDRLDINPAAAAMAEARHLRADAPVAAEVPDAQSSDDRLRSELERLEEVATMPLDLETDPKRLRRRAASRPAAPDEITDFVLKLPGEEPVRRDEALGVYKQNEYRLEKPRKLYGKNLDARYWTELDRDPPQARYSDLALAIQLVDERGPLDESELNTFAQVGLKLADALHRPTMFAESFEQALEHAQRLHRFCETYDVIAAIHVAAQDKAVFRGRAIRQAAERLGMQFGAMNIFHMKSNTAAGCQHLFSLASMIKPGEFNPDNWDSFIAPGVTLFMSVPCAHHPVEVFDRMAETARELARALGGELLDQDRRPLNNKGIAVIRRQVEEIEHKMRAYGVTPGTATALRLFGSAAVQQPTIVTEPTETTTSHA